MNKTIIKRPVVTEKTMQLVSRGEYSFEVARTANKKEIAKSVKRNFGVDAIDVRTNTRPGKTKRVLRTRKTTTLPARKFAVVKLKKGQKIEGFEKLLEVPQSEE